MSAQFCTAFCQWIQRDVQLAFRHPADMMQPLLFFVLVVCIFPLGISPETKLLHTIAPGLIWVSALLAILLSLGQLFARDAQDGTLTQFLLTPHYLSMMVLAKFIAQWWISVVPLLLLVPILGGILSLSWGEISVLWLSLLLGTPILILIGGIGAALTLNARGSSNILLPLLVLPLSIPVIIFGTSSVMNFNSQLPVAPLLWLLLAMLVLALTLAPLATAAALRLSVE